MNASPSPEDIIDALRKSGYLMEQEVATQLEALKFNVPLARNEIKNDDTQEIDRKALIAKIRSQPEYKEKYDEAAPEFDLLRKMLEARKRAGLTLNSALGTLKGESSGPKSEY